MVEEILNNIIFITIKTSTMNQKKNEKWISWDIQFKENTDRQEKLKAITEIQKQILEYLYKQDLQGLLKSIGFSFKPKPGIKSLPIHIQMNVELNQQNLNPEISAREGVRNPPPPPPPPAFRHHSPIRKIYDVLSGSEIL